MTRNERMLVYWIFGSAIGLGIGHLYFTMLLQAFAATAFIFYLTRPGRKD